MPRAKHPESSRTGALRAICGLIEAVYPETSGDTVSAGIEWLCTFLGASECRLLTASEAPPQPTAQGDTLLVPAYVNGAVRGGVALTFPQGPEAAKLDAELLDVCAAILVCANRQREAEKQTGAVVRRFLQLEENEKRRIGRDLHDNTAQQLAVIRLRMELLEMSPKRGEELLSHLHQIREVTEKAIVDVRRLIADLSPSVLDQLGLMAAIRQLANRFKTECQCEIDVQPASLPSLDADAQLTVYRLVQSMFRYLTENLETIHLNLLLEEADGVLGVSVEGTIRLNGVSSHPGTLRLEGSSLWDRVRLLGGSVAGEIRPSAKGQGHVSLQLQVPEPNSPSTI